jgi:hypothetical protein
MESEYKFRVMHEQTSSDNLVIVESLHTNHHSGHTLTKVDANDNQPVAAALALSNNRTLTKATNTVVRGIVDSKLNSFITHRHEIRKETSTTAVVAMSYSEDNINNNCDISTSTSSTGVGVMSQQNFVLNFDHQQTPSPLSACETLLSPAEAPFGRRYAEISQFKNHPNVEW